MSAFRGEARWRGPDAAPSPAPGVRPRRKAPAAGAPGAPLAPLEAGAGLAGGWESLPWVVPGAAAAPGGEAEAAAGAERWAEAPGPG